jgi:hypothetical protein
MADEMRKENNAVLSENMVNPEVTIDEPTVEQIQRGERAVKRARPTLPPTFDPDQMANSLESGVLQLKEPIYNGDDRYDELAFDFTLLKGMELARALDFGERRGDKFAMELTDVQALNYFACAAAKCQETQGGLDASDIRTRIGGADAIKAIQLATCFFKFTSLAGDLRFKKKSSEPAG